MGDACTRISIEDNIGCRSVIPAFFMPLSKFSCLYSPHRFMNLSCLRQYWIGISQLADELRQHILPHPQSSWISLIIIAMGKLPLLYLYLLTRLQNVPCHSFHLIEKVAGVHARVHSGGRRATHGHCSHVQCHFLKCNNCCAIRELRLFLGCVPCW